METVVERNYGSKRRKVEESLLELATRRGRGVKLPTIQELCIQLETCRPTLDRAMVALEKRGVLCRKHGSGIYVSPTIGRKTIGVMFGGDIFGPGISPFWNLLLQAVRQQSGERELRPQAYLDISQGHDGIGGHTQLVEDLEARRLDGLLLLGPPFNRDAAAELRAYGVPLVVLGGKAPQDWTVTLDWDSFCGLAARELARTDCRRIGLMGPPTHRIVLERELRAAGAAAVQIADWSYETWSRIIPGADLREQCATLVVRRMIAAAATDPLPDTLVSMDDTATRGALIALMDAGIKPGRDIRVVTGVNKGSPVLDAWADVLAPFAFDPAEIMQAALGMLETLMKGGTPARNPVRIGACERVSGWRIGRAAP